MTLTEYLNDIEMWKSLILDMKHTRYYKDFASADTNILVAQWITGTYEFGYPTCVEVPKSTPGKFREVFVYRPADNLLLKAINNWLYAECGSDISSRVYSYKRGVSINVALRDLVSQNRKAPLHYLKLDLKNYFTDVCPDAIARFMEKYFTVSELMMLNPLFTDHCYVANNLVQKSMGILPGCPLSAFFSNALLRSIDDWVEANSEFYIRYSDDLLIGVADEKDMNFVTEGIRCRLLDFGLHINESKTKTFQPGQAVGFLGMETKGTTIDLGQVHVANIKNRIKHLCKVFRNKYEVSLKRRRSIPEYYVKKALHSFNKWFYSYVLHDNDRAGMAGFVFGNVTVFDTLVELDKYFLSQLRYVMTGVHNSSKKAELTTEYFENLGWTSFCTMKKYYDADRCVYIGEVYALVGGS